MKHWLYPDLSDKKQYQKLIKTKSDEENNFSSLRIGSGDADADGVLYGTIVPGDRKRQF